MPTIEIVSFGATSLDLKQSGFSVVLEKENRLVSHRGLFYDWLLPQPGVIVHLGDPDRPEVTSAGALIDWADSPGFIYIGENHDNSLDDDANPSSGFRFRPAFRADITRLIQIALQGSPEHKAGFLTDYQFGPSEGQIVNIGNLDDFWVEHDHNKLTFNVFYAIGLA